MKDVQGPSTLQPRVPRAPPRQLSSLAYFRSMGSGSSKDASGDPATADQRRQQARGTARALANLNKPASDSPPEAVHSDRGESHQHATPVEPLSQPPGPPDGPSPTAPPGRGIAPPGRGRGMPSPGRGPPGRGPGAPGAPGRGPPGGAMPGRGPPGAPMPGRGQPMPGRGPPGAPMPGRGPHGAPMPGRGPPGAPMPGRGPPGMQMPGRGGPPPGHVDARTQATGASTDASPEASRPHGIPAGEAASTSHTGTALEPRGPVQGGGASGTGGGDVAASGKSSGARGAGAASGRAMLPDQSISDRLKALDAQLEGMAQQESPAVEAAVKKPAANLMELRQRAETLRAQWERLEAEKEARRQRRSLAQAQAEGTTPGGHDTGLSGTRGGVGGAGGETAGRGIEDYVQPLEPDVLTPVAERHGDVPKPRRIGGGAVVKTDGPGYEILHIGKDGRRVNAAGRPIAGELSPGRGAAHPADRGVRRQKKRAAKRPDDKQEGARPGAMEGDGEARAQKGAREGAETTGEADKARTQPDGQRGRDAPPRAVPRRPPKPKESDGSGGEGQAPLVRMQSWTLYDREAREKRMNRPKPTEVEVSRPDTAEINKRKEWHREKRERERKQKEEAQRKAEDEEKKKKEEEERTRVEKARVLEERLKKEEQEREARKKELEVRLKKEDQEREERERNYRKEIRKVRGKVPLHERRQAELEEQEEQERRRLEAEMLERKQQLRQYQPAVLIPKIIPEDKRKKPETYVEGQEWAEIEERRQRAKEKRIAEEKEKAEKEAARLAALEAERAEQQRRDSEERKRVKVALVAGAGGVVYVRIGADGNDPDVTLTREEQFRVPRRKTPPPPMRVPTPEVAHDEADYVSIASTDTGDFELGSDLGGDVDTDSDLGEEWREVEERIHERISALRAELERQVDADIAARDLNHPGGAAHAGTAVVGGDSPAPSVASRGQSDRGNPHEHASGGEGSGEMQGAIAVLNRRAPSKQGSYRLSRLGSMSGAHSSHGGGGPARVSDSSQVKMQRLRSSSFRLSRRGSQAGSAVDIPDDSGDEVAVPVVRRQPSQLGNGLPKEQSAGGLAAEVSEALMREEDDGEVSSLVEEEAGLQGASGGNMEESIEDIPELDEGVGAEVVSA